MDRSPTLRHDVDDGCTALHKEFDDMQVKLSRLAKGEHGMANPSDIKTGGGDLWRKPRSEGEVMEFISCTWDMNRTGTCLLCIVYVSECNRGSTGAAVSSPAAGLRVNPFRLGQDR